MSIVEQRSSVSRGLVIRALVPVYLGLIAGVPLVVATLPITGARSATSRTAALLLAGPIYCAAYVLVAGLLSRLTLASIVAGKYPRELSHEIYGPRRLYALCWTAIYYCAPIYHAVLAVPLLRHSVFRLFGYRGSLDFQTYPDTWIRDLPLLSIGEGAYLSNKATISPNMCLRNGEIIVLPVTIGAGTMVGHLTMIAPGVEIGTDSEIGTGAAVGINVRIGSRTLVDHEVVIDHDVVIGDRCVVGIRAYIGRKAVVGDGVRIPPGTVVPARRVLATQVDVEALTSDVLWRFTALSLQR